MRHGGVPSESLQLNLFNNRWFPSTSNPDGEGIGSGNGDGPPLVRTKTREFGLGFFPPGDTTIYDENGSSQDPTYDFRQVAIHELIHGMGFMSSWNRPLHPESLLPSNPIIDDITEKNSTIKVVTFAKSYIFDKMMMHSGTGVFMRDYAQAIRNESVKLSQKIFDEKPNINESELLAEWAPEFMSSKAYQLSKNLMEKVATTPMQLVTWYLDSSQKSRYVILHTPNEYSAGHSLGHVDSTVYGGTTEFLMRPYATAGVGLAAQTPRSKSTVLGAAVVGILCQMGYKNV
ncbi:hypothetical protein HDU84_007778 [Entophlyctis sp. JEL0112]|nr:hypothetical protein HDU84_007778 [Entophlyctis sp. JEL0112]